MGGGGNNLIEAATFVNNEQPWSLAKAICYQSGSKKQKRVVTIAMEGKERNISTKFLETTLLSLFYFISDNHNLKNSSSITPFFKFIEVRFKLTTIRKGNGTSKN